MAMASKEQRVSTVPATVVEKLPNDLYRLELENQSRIIAHVSSRRDQDFLRLLPGDRVQVNLSPRDHTRGRIVERCLS